MVDCATCVKAAAWDTVIRSTGIGAVAIGGVDWGSDWPEATAIFRLILITSCLLLRLAHAIERRLLRCGGLSPGTHLSTSSVDEVIRQNDDHCEKIYKEAGIERHSHVEEKVWRKSVK